MLKTTHLEHTLGEKNAIHQREQLLFKKKTAVTPDTDFYIF